jgi:hypothetical protein
MLLNQVLHIPYFFFEFVAKDYYQMNHYKIFYKNLYLRTKILMDVFEKMFANNQIMNNFDNTMLEHLDHFAMRM